ncbi:hypothetical protein [Paenibacillus taichungensis]|uniref:hypothetical protein n=1 Tax=Paenibacillus taichungensis TaxID=484184 RepID=UPI0038D237C4
MNIVIEEPMNLWNARALNAGHNEFQRTYNKLKIQPQYEDKSRLFIAVSSSEATEVALSVGDVLICFAETVFNLRKRVQAIKA